MIFAKRLKFGKPLFISLHRGLIHFNGGNRPKSNNLPVKLISNDPSSVRDAINILESSSGDMEIDTYTQLLEACIQSKSITEGKKIHRHILEKKTHISNYTLLEKLTYLYVTCGEIDLARKVFDQIPRPNIILWNLLIRGYAWNGPFDEAIDLFYRMIDVGIRPNKFTFPVVLKACSGLEAAEDGKEIHLHVNRLGLHSDVYICTALVDFYAKCGCLSEAHTVFDKMQNRDVVSWNSIISGHSLHGLYEDAMKLVFKMQIAGVSPNFSTIVSILPAVGQAKALNQGKGIHGYCVRRDFGKDVQAGTALLDMYGKCNHLTYARRVFDILGTKNEVTWSAIIGAYVLCDHTREALTLFDKMLCDENVNLSPVTLGSVLRGCAKLSDMSKGKQIHGYLIKSGFVLDIMVANSLLAMYAKSGSLDAANRFFGEMELKDTVSFSALISGCVQNGKAEDALVIFRKMQESKIEPDIATMVGILPACAHLSALESGRCNHSYLIVRGFVSDTSIGNALIDMYSKCGRIKFARQVFDRMPNRDIISWNAIILGYGIHGLGTESLLLFQDLLSLGLKPDDVTFINLLSACSHAGLVPEGKYWFTAMNQDFSIIPRIAHYICMVDLLGRGGLLDEAYDFIKKMSFDPDVRIWGALLGACRVHGNIELGEEVSNKIQMLGPEGTGNFVLLSNIYSAAGRWDDAAQVRIVQRDKGFKKSPGCSWIEINRSVHAFVGGDKSHLQSAWIYEKLEELLVEMKKLGYRADTSFVLQDVEEEEKERILLYHSEKLAIAFGILSLSPSKPIFVTKNLRVCGDCHSAIKFISKITNRAITVRDATRFHHFRGGSCNCGDFW